MTIEDPLLPAATHLTGPYAADVLRPAIGRAGGSLHDHRCTQVFYRPGHEVVVQFRTEVTWSDGRRRRETILAASTSSGPPPGSVAVTAEVPGGELTVGVWRWPFDPALTALEDVVRSTSTVLSDAGVIEADTQLEVDVVSYRPMERAVLRVRTAGSTWYVKVLRPARAADVADRYRRMRRHGLPVPEVVAADPARGWMLIDELSGPTFRDLIKRGADDWLEPGDLRELVRELAALDDDGVPAFRSRLADGPHHASLLASVLPDGPARMTRLCDFLEAEAERSRERARGFVHGDLHEAQLIVDEGRIVGLLDIDEAGSGDPIDDIAVPAAHLRHRALTASNGPAINAFVDEFVAACAADHRPRDIAAGTVAVLVGLATAPFRSQSAGWADRVEVVLELAERHLPPG